MMEVPSITNIAFDRAADLCLVAVGVVVVLHRDVTARVDELADGTELIGYIVVNDPANQHALREILLTNRRTALDIVVLQTSRGAAPEVGFVRNDIPTLLVDDPHHSTLPVVGEIALIRPRNNADDAVRTVPGIRVASKRRGITIRIVSPRRDRIGRAVGEGLR